MTLIQHILDLFFPEVCLLCKKSSVVVCSSCMTSLTPYPNNNKSLPKFISPVFSYKDSNVKKLIWAFKYSNKKQLAPLLAQSMQDTLQATFSDLYEIKGVRSVLVLPIPLHTTRYREREYNQSELLVREVFQSTENNTLVADYSLLVRRKKTPPNAKSQSRRERALNTIGSFEVSDYSKVSGRHIILVDDVVTTGTTLSEARKVLLSAGARTVNAVTLAH